ncbi:MAG: NAD(P)-dependent oxidoreductase [Oscillospiraceae bacterium]|nr:NAD(P)-dependent oxidoreductase [Oscillospiraceae bacterium]
MKVFITGGTGNIGQCVAIAAAKRGHEVSVLSRTPEKYGGLSKINTGGKPIAVKQGFLRDYDKIGEYIKGCDAVIHVALGWGNEPITMCTEDTLPTVTLLEMSERAGIKKFIYTSSTAAMGHNRRDMDETALLMPLNLYGSTKAACESYVLGFTEYCAEAGTTGEHVDMKRNIIRPGYTFSNPAYEGGSSQLDRRFRDITDAIVKSYPIQLIKNDGTQFISATQIAEVYMAILESDYNEEVFLALSGEFTSWEKIARIALEEYPESKSTIELYDKNYDPNPMLYSVNKIKEKFGLAFFGDEELRKHIKWNVEQSLARKGK